MRREEDGSHCLNEERERMEWFNTHKWNIRWCYSDDVDVEKQMVLLSSENENG